MNRIILRVILLLALYHRVDCSLISCYTSHDSLEPERIDPFLCTHLILIGGTTVNDQGILDAPPDSIISRYRRLRDVNKNLKLLVSLTPYNSIMSKIVVSDTLTSVMARSVSSYLTQNALDGFDIDWEFPSWSSDAKKTDRKGFAVLLRKLRAAFDVSGRSLLITLAVGAPYTIADKGYDIAALNSYVDFVQIMNYDFHAFSKLEPFTGFNAPLRAAFYELGPVRKMNSDYSTRNWLKLGVLKSKLVFGIPTYARGYHLLTKYLHFPYAPATGASVYGDSITFPSICSIANSTDVTIKWSRAASSPYLHAGKEWLSFESQRSVTEKAQYAKNAGLAGVMVFSLMHDDYEGTCGTSRYPLTNAIKAVMVGES